MALVFADRVKVRSNSTGTGDFTLDETAHAHQSFDAVGDGNETYYGIVDSNGNWEIGRGTYTAPNILSRDSILSSSNSNELVDFPSGGKNVFVTFPASLAVSTTTNSFATISVSGQSDVVADSNNDTLTLVAGSNITITTDADTDSITINSTASGSGGSFDQDLNTTDTPTFNGAELTGNLFFTDTGGIYPDTGSSLDIVGGPDIPVTITTTNGVNDLIWIFGVDGSLRVPADAAIYPPTSGPNAGYDITINGGESDSDTGGSINLFSGVGNGGLSNGAINIGTANEGAINIGGSTSTITVNANVYGGLGNRLWLGGGDTEGSPSINIPNEANGAAQAISVSNQAGGGVELSAYGATNDYTSSVLLDDDFSVNTNNSSMILEGTGAWRIGSNNFDHNVQAIDPENDPGIGITVGNDLWVFNDKLSKVSSGDLVLSVDSGDSSVYDWNFGTDGVLTFPDGTAQTTAYNPTSGTPLWVVVNVSGEVSFSEDNGINWTAGQTITSSGNPVQGVIRVTIGPDNIVYLADDSGGNTTVLYYGIGMSYNVTQVDPDIPIEADAEIEGYFDWRDIEYASGYYIVVGEYVSLTTPAETVYPVMYYSTDGINWTQGSIDPGYVAAVDSTLRSVDYDGIGWLIIGGEGAFYITNPSEQLTESNYTPIADPVVSNPDRVAYTGTQWVVRNGNTVYFAPAGNPLAIEWAAVDLDPIMIEEFGGDRPEEDPLAIDEGLTEMAGGEINGEYWFVVGTSNGQILATKDGGSNWYSHVPQPHTGTVLDIASDSSSTIILIDWDQGPLDHGNKITITGATGATELNGTYYVESTPDQTEWILWQNSDFTGPVDSSGWGTYDGTSATITFYKGTFFDGLAFGGGKFIAANDDEQLFSVTDVAAGEWTKVNDQNDTFDYWDDIDYYDSFGAGTAAPSNRLVSGNVQVSLDSTGRLILPGSVVLDTVYPATYTDTPIALDLNTTVQKVAGGAGYTLANGYEGQIMYFVADGAIDGNVYITLNARMMSDYQTVNEYDGAGWILFDHRDAAYYDVTPATEGAATSMYTAIFTDGYWNVSGGIRD